MSNGTTPNRRRFLATTAGVTAILAGCSDEVPDEEPDESGTEESSTESDGNDDSTDGDEEDDAEPDEEAIDITAELVLEPEEIEAGETVLMDGSNSTSDPHDIKLMAFEYGESIETETTDESTEVVVDEPGEYEVELSVYDDEDNKAVDTETLSVLEGTTFEDIYRETIPDENSAVARTVENQMDIEEVEDRLHENMSVSYKIETMFSLAAKVVEREQGTDATRYVAHEMFDIEPGTEAVIDNRTGYSGGEIPLTAVYVNEGTEDDPEWHKDLGAPIGNATGSGGEDYLRHDEQVRSVTERNLDGMFDSGNAANYVPTDLGAIKKRIEYIGRDEYSEAQWESEWNSYLRGVQNLLVGDNFFEGDFAEDGKVDEFKVAPTWDAWEYIGEQERESRGISNLWVNDLREINLAAHDPEKYVGRELQDDEYLEIDVEQGNLQFGVISQSEYSPSSMADENMTFS